MARKALFMVLSSKAKDKQLFVLDNIILENPKGKFSGYITWIIFLLMLSGFDLLDSNQILFNQNISIFITN